jgi:hypothetical protein
LQEIQKVRGIRMRICSITRFKCAYFISSEKIVLTKYSICYIEIYSGIKISPDSILTSFIKRYEIELTIYN